MSIVTKVCYSRSESIVIKGMLNVVSGNKRINLAQKIAN